MPSKLARAWAASGYWRGYITLATSRLRPLPQLRSPALGTVDDLTTCVGRREPVPVRATLFFVPKTPALGQGPHIHELDDAKTAGRRSLATGATENVSRKPRTSFTFVRHAMPTRQAESQRPVPRGR